ncbi:putative secreted protein (Por secretion system target) [Mariniflexile fucanivorans]|uniref:Putative secreted protein (Por secretion system target) n=1 Tax=Mariniflexile fucanivorans TaxID=264023 RepID=A0A4R1RJB2_9FLAO|nr:carbohydrate-binding protein [Mariniflexile fucanivorans]TCL66233.1 putative secreted protein (Por secretion system target) [Mariniflexile fucanivorans]
MKKTTLLMIVGCICFIGLSANLNAQTLTPSHNFDDGSMEPFHDCTVRLPNYTAVANGRVKTFWTSEWFTMGTPAGDVNRTDKGCEMCILTERFHTQKEGWYGFTMNVGSDYRTDSNAGVAQVFGFSNNYYTWEAMLKITNNDLIMGYRGRGNEQPGADDITDTTVLPSVPRDTDLNIIIHFILSASNNGVMEVWIDGVKKMIHTGINLGFGTWVDDAVDCGETDGIPNCRTEFKAGQYNYDPDGYMANETRTIYYDNVTWYNGSNGYAIVDPSGNTNIGDTRNYELLLANAYNIKSGMDIETDNQNLGNIGRDDYALYIDVDLSSIKSVKALTSTKRDGGNIEVRLGSKTGELIATIPVPNNGQWHDYKPQAVDLTTSKTGIHDVYFVFKNESRSTGLFNVTSFGFSGQSLSIDSNSLSNKIKLYPNPVSKELTVSLTNANLSNNTKITLYSINGQKILEVSPKNDRNPSLNLSNLQKGVYFLKIDDASNSITKKVVKI